MLTRNYLWRLLIIFWTLHVISCSSYDVTKALGMSSEYADAFALPMPASAIKPPSSATSKKLSVVTRQKHCLKQNMSGSLVISNISVQQTNGTISSLKSDNLSIAAHEESLLQLLMKIISQDLDGCDFIILFDRSFKDSQVLKTFLQQPNFKQVMMLGQISTDKRNIVSWMSCRCQGILILISDASPLIDMWDMWPGEWDHSSRLIIAGLTMESLDKIIKRKKATKIEHMLAIVKVDRIGTFKIFMNKLFWGRGELQQISTWRRNSFTLEANPFPDKISNLHGAELVLISFELEPFIINHIGPDNQLLYHYGREVELYKTLQRIFNFTIVHQEPAKGELFGVPLPNGSFNGMTGMLDKGEGDLAIDDLWLIIDRTPFLDYSTPYSVDQGCFMAPVAPPLAPWESPALPFQPITWIVIFLGMVLAGPVLYLLVIARENSSSETKNLRSLPTSAFHAIAIHFSQPMAILPKESSTQIFVAFLWLYSVILTTGYKSNLTAFLTITNEPKSIDTIEELYESGLRVIGYNFFADQFERSKIDYVKNLAKRYDTYLQFEEVKGDILTGKAVLINSVKYLEFHIGKMSSSIGKSSFRIMKECMPQYSVVMAYQKYSPLKRKFDPVITRIFESGLPRKWFLDSIDTYRMCCTESNTSSYDGPSYRKPGRTAYSWRMSARAGRIFRLNKQGTEGQQIPADGTEDGVIPLTLAHMQGIFIIWAFGTFLGIIMFISEMVFA